MKYKVKEKGSGRSSGRDCTCIWFYYNCNKKSDLEVLLNNHKPDQVTLDNAKIALDTIRRLGISKYNPVGIKTRSFCFKTISFLENIIKVD